MAGGGLIVEAWTMKWQRYRLHGHDGVQRLALSCIEWSGRYWRLEISIVGSEITEMEDRACVETEAKCSTCNWVVTTAVFTRHAVYLSHIICVKVSYILMHKSMKICLTYDYWVSTKLAQVVFWSISHFTAAHFVDDQNTCLLVCRVRCAIHLHCRPTCMQQTYVNIFHFMTMHYVINELFKFNMRRIDLYSLLNAQR